ncbi:MAG: hypothetical protein HQM03_21070 [Magnetococcales bacterium]|nr:hypothetical protein [Magnetococcales bacterium]
MPKLELHYQASLARTGKEYREIHEWIDEPGCKYERHDLGKVLEYAGMWRDKYGEEGAREYLQHLQDDVEARFNHLMEDMQKILNDNLAYFGCLSTANTGEKQ